MLEVSIPRLAAASVLLAIAMGIELRTKLIPNWLVLAGLVAGLALAAADGRWLGSLGGLAIIFVPGFAFYGRYRALLGGGAIKLAAVYGLIVGPALAAMSLGYTLVWWWLRYLLAPPRTEEQMKSLAIRRLQGSPVLTTSFIVGTGVLYALVKLGYV